MIRRVNRFCLVILFLLTGLVDCPLSLAGDKGGREQAAELLARAAEVSNLRSPSSPPFHLAATLRVFGVRGKPLEGTYTLWWNSEKQWREEVHLFGYDRLRIGAEGSYWQVRSQPEEPALILPLDHTIHFASGLRIGPKQKPGNPKPRKIEGKEAVCFSPSPSEPRLSELCFNLVTGALVMEKNAIMSFISASERSERTFGDWITWEGKVFPQKINMYAGGRPALEVRVTKLARDEAISPALFVIPANAEEWGWCPEMHGPEKLHHVQPRYPEAAKRNRMSGVVIVYGVIDGDGSLSRLKVIQSAGMALDNAVLEAIRQWRYVPRSCKGKGVRTETYIEVSFTLI